MYIKLINRARPRFPSSRLQHGGDTGPALLDRLREQSRVRDLPKGRGDEIRLLSYPCMDRVLV